MENVLRGYFHYPEVIVAITLNFKPNFKFSRLNFFGGTPVPLQVCAIKAWSISSACKIFGAQHPLWAEIQSAKQCILVGPNSHVIPSRQWTKVHRTFSLNAGGIAIVCNVGRFRISLAVPEIFAIKSEVVQNRPKFCMFLAPRFFWGSAPLMFGLALYNQARF